MAWFDKASRADLEKIRTDLDGIIHCLRDLEACGFAPTVDLTPGRASVIHLNACVLGVVAPDAIAAPEQTLYRAGCGGHGDGAELTAPDPSPVVPEPVPEPVPVAVVPTTVAPAAAGAKAANWSAQEDQQAIDRAANLMARGVSLAKASTAVAASLGRTAAATQFHLRKKGLVERLAVAIAALGAGPVAAKTAADRVAVPRDAAARPEDIAPKQAPSTTPVAPGDPFNTELDHHLRTLRRNGTPWTAAMDRDVIDLACDGLGHQDIAAEIGMDSGAVKARFDLLTGLHRDESDKWVRRFPRAAVQAGLAALFPTQAAAE